MCDMLTPSICKLTCNHCRQYLNLLMLSSLTAALNPPASESTLCHLLLLLSASGLPSPPRRSTLLPVASPSPAWLVPLVVCGIFGWGVGERESGGATGEVGDSGSAYDDVAGW
jgi:hypothetical protein